LTKADGCKKVGFSNSKLLLNKIMWSLPSFCAKTFISEEVDDGVVAVIWAVVGTL